MMDIRTRHVFALPEDYINKEFTICSPLPPPPHSVRRLLSFYLLLSRLCVQPQKLFFFFKVYLYWQANSNMGVLWAKYRQNIWDLSKRLPMLISSFVHLQNIGRGVNSSQIIINEAAVSFVSLFSCQGESWQEVYWRLCVRKRSHGRGFIPR